MRLLQHIAYGIVALALLFAGLFAGYRYGSTRHEAVDVEVVIDTVYYERPIPYSYSARNVMINVPRMMFAERNADGSELSKNDNFFTDDGKFSADSVALTVEIETRLYEDSLYRAQVSGPAIADLHPTLDWVQVYNHTVTQTVTKRHRFAIGVQVGYGATLYNGSIRPSPYVGIGLQYNIWSF